MARKPKPHGSTGPTEARIAEMVKAVEEGHGGAPFIPPFCREIDQFGLADTYYASHAPVADLWGYVQLPKTQVCHGAYIKIYHDATGVIVNREWEFNDAHPAPAGKDSCRMLVRFYAFGCDHKMERISRDGNCLNTYRCRVCGFTQQIDSSD